MTETATTNVTLDDLLDLIFEVAGPSDLIRLVAESRTDYGDVDYFFTKRGSSPWHWPPGATAHADTPRAVVQRNQDTVVRWSPLLYQRSPMRNGPAVLSAVWAALPVNTTASRLNPSLGTIDAESERTALARIAAASPSPSMVLHEGRRLVALWRLKEAIPAPPEPLNESRCGPYAHRPEEVAQRALWALALRLNGDRASIDPRRQTFAIPGTPMPGIFPRREVAVILGSDVERRFSIDELL